MGKRGDYATPASEWGPVNFGKRRAMQDDRVDSEGIAPRMTQAQSTLRDDPLSVSTFGAAHCGGSTFGLVTQLWAVPDSLNKVTL
jgi:hypothetical protein